MKKSLLILVILCLHFPGIGNAVGECKYGENDLAAGADRQIMIEKATGLPTNGLSCRYNIGSWLVERQDSTNF